MWRLRAAKARHRDIKDGCHIGHLRILQTISPEWFVGLHLNLMGGSRLSLRSTL